MHINIDDISGVEISPSVCERVLLNPTQTKSGKLLVKHYVISEGEIAFKYSDVEFQHYIISGCGLFRNKLVHGDTAIFVPGSQRLNENRKYVIKHMGESELRLLSIFYKIPHPNFKWAKTRIRNLNQVNGNFGGMYAQQIFTEEEHALMGARRYHSLDVQTHAPGVKLGIHRNPEEFGYFLRGNGEVFSGKKRVKVRPGSLVYTPEGVPHSIINTNEIHPLQYVAFEFTRQDESWNEMGVK
jgi:mannose-6-phosphate isomerase-like protein (cupin superfamily)